MAEIIIEGETIEDIKKGLETVKVMRKSLKKRRSKKKRKKPKKAQDSRLSISSPITSRKENSDVPLLLRCRLWFFPRFLIIG